MALYMNRICDIDSKYHTIFLEHETTKILPFLKPLILGPLGPQGPLEPRPIAGFQNKKKSRFLSDQYEATLKG